MSLLKLCRYLHARLFSLIFRLPNPGLQNYIIPNWYYGIMAGVIIIDQISKLWIHAHMQLGEMRTLFTWPMNIKLHYFHNPGLGKDLYKLLQPILDRLVWTYEDMVTCPSIKIGGTLLGIGWGIISYYLLTHVIIPRLSKYSPKLNLMMFGAALLIGGGFSNNIDHIFYGVLLNNSIVEDSPTRLFCGQVIDFIRFDNNIIPIFNNSGVMNLADVAINLGVMLWVVGVCIAHAVYIRQDYKAWEQSLEHGSK